MSAAARGSSEVTAKHGARVLFEGSYACFITAKDTISCDPGTIACYLTLTATGIRVKESWRRRL